MTTLGPDEWQALLEPYGWAEITMHSPAVIFRQLSPPPILDYEIRIMLKPSARFVDFEHEWALREDLFAQARGACNAVKDAGYVFEDASRVEIGGRYVRNYGGESIYIADASVIMNVVEGKL